MRLATLACCLLAAALATAADPLPPSTPMQLIPAGEFTMGRQSSTEMPAHRVVLSAFWLDEHEVTNAQYQAFCEATGRTLPVYWNVERFQCGEAWPEHPVIGVSLVDARDYAEWVGKRIPTEAEWEYAARAGGEGRFGGDLDELTIELANYKRSPFDAPTDVKSYAPNAYGVYDLIGNVREWTTDYLGAEIPASSLVPEDGDLTGVVPLVDPTGPEKGRTGVVRGGGWYSGSSCQAVTVRNGYPRTWGDFAVGFRCARSAD
ncbi:MAG: formylglycine-generating enzyme family protein [Candidatus Krumholzibacteriia bacterium]